MSDTVNASVHYTVHTQPNHQPHTVCVDKRPDNRIKEHTDALPM